MSGRFVLSHELARKRALQYIAQAPQGYVVTVKPPTRTGEQNNLLWSLLSDIAAQVVWHGRKLPPESWKHIFSAALKKQEVVPNIDGTGFVILGLSTSRMTKGEMSELIELITAFGAERGVSFSGQNDRVLTRQPVY